MTEKIFIRAEIQGELPSGQKVVNLLATNADGFVFCTDDKSIVRPQEIKAKEIDEFIMRFERQIKDMQVTLGQTFEIQSALKTAKKEMVGDTE